MTTISNIKSILETQRNTITKLDEEISILSNSDFIKENAEFKKKIVSLEEKLDDTEEKLAELSQENKSLKNALYQQIYNEKISIINLSAKKLNIYFKSKCEGELNQLSQIEANARKQIDNITQSLKENNVDLSDEIYLQLYELENLLDVKVTEIRKNYAQQKGSFSVNASAEYKRLKNEQISDEQIINSVKKSNWEAFIGQNLINKAGIFLVIIGVIAASQVTYFKLPDMLKCIIIFILGAFMLVLGEILNNKKTNIFSIGISSGGVALLYIAISVSYFMYDIISMYPALIFCILITTVSFLLSKRYDSATIAAFSLVGGYLPILSVTGSVTLIWATMVYFIILNLLIFLLSFHRKWIVCYFIGLTLNCFGTCYLFMNSEQSFINTGNAIISILYILLGFGMYTAIPMISCYTQDIKFQKADIILIAINTFLSSIFMYFVFYLFNLESFKGILAILFALIYLLAGKFVEIKLTNEKKVSALFYLTGFAFVVLIIPLQFDKVWLSLGWLTEAIALIIYGILNDIKIFKKSGYIVGALCLAAFIEFDLLGGFGYLFGYKYFAITLGSILILCTYIYKKSLSNQFEIVYKYVTLVNIWLYCLYLIGIKLSEIISVEIFNEYYLTSMLALAVSFVIAFILPRIKILSDQGVKIISNVIVCLSIIGLLALNEIQNPFKIIHFIPQNYYVWLAIIVGVMGLISAFALYDALKSIIIDKSLCVEWLPLILSGYILILLTQNLTVQFNLSFTNMIISILYAFTALACILLGFIKRYTLIRKFGLGLSIISVAKLFIVDLSYLTENNKIISYFALGISLIAISFVYQYFSKRLEIKGGIVSDD